MTPRPEKRGETYLADLRCLSDCGAVTVRNGGGRFNRLVSVGLAQSFMTADWQMAYRLSPEGLAYCRRRGWR